MRLYQPNCYNIACKLQANRTVKFERFYMRWILTILLSSSLMLLAACDEPNRDVAPSGMCSVNEEHTKGCAE